MPLRDAVKNEIERLLRDGMDELEEALRGVAGDRASLRPCPESWSVLECVEHLTLTEEALLSRLKGATQAEGSREDRAREARFLELAMNRQRRIEAPEPVIPKPGSQTLAQALDEFQKIRCETMRFVDEFEGDLKAWLTIHPLITRPVNCYEMLLLIALHPKRHAQQIALVREQLSNPRSQME
jgi:hypothetical protein